MLRRRIAELGENKHAVWSILRQQQPQKPKGETEPTATAAIAKGAGGSASARSGEPTVDGANKLPAVDAVALREREAALRAAEAALAQEARVRTDALSLREAALAQKEGALEKVSPLTSSHPHSRLLRRTNRLAQPTMCRHA